MNLLITDDEMIAVNSLMASISWEECGIDQVYVAYSAEGAREVCQEHLIDILLCDIEMPGESGIELVRWIKETNAEIECLFLTCHMDFHYAKEAIHLGCCEYIVKPAPYEEIEEAIRKLVTRIGVQKKKSQLEDYGRQWITQKKEKLESDHGKRLSAAEVAGKVERYIMEHLAEKITLDQIAQFVYLHPDYVGRIFKKEKGVSVNQYIITERMRLAAHMLQETDTPAAVIAMEVGYENYPNFVNMFKKVYGISPSRYKEKYHDTEI